MSRMSQENLALNLLAVYRMSTVVVILSGVRRAVRIGTVIHLYSTVNIYICPFPTPIAYSAVQLDGDDSTLLQLKYLQRDTST